HVSVSPRHVPLRALRSCPPRLSPDLTSLTFGSFNIGTPSTAQGITLTNSGTAALSITSIAITGTNTADFSQTNNCGSSVAVAAKCPNTAPLNPAPPPRPYALVPLSKH